MRKTSWAMLVVAGLLAAWTAVLFVASTGRKLTLDASARKQHWLQAFAHLSIYLYWGYHWRTVYQSAHLIAAQVVFAYAFDVLLTWSRRDHYTLTFGPFPIVFSTNLFLWFKPPWFHLQFVMIALGMLAKQFIQWERDGRRTHVFNP